MTQAPPISLRRDPLPTREDVGPKTPAVAKPKRLVSLDAYRGLIMIFLASSAFGLHRVANDPRVGDKDSAFWKAVSFQTDHVEWQGGTLFNLMGTDEASARANRVGDWFGGGVWDLIQPSFMFMAGVAMPFSFASRLARGDSMARIWRHVFVRAFLLIALGIFLRSTGSPRTNFTFEDVITQIGLGYPIVFLVFLLGRRFGAWPIVHLAALAAILVGYWAYFAYWPLRAAGFDYGTVGLAHGPWPWADGLFAHWNKNTNAAQWFDVWFLNLFPRNSPWKFNGGGYLTLNFVPSMATAIFGLTAGELLRGSWPRWAKFLTLLALAAACLSVGAFAGETVCPIVKRIWTPSWAVYAAGWTFLMLALFYGIVDGIGFKWWTFPLVVVGMNSIAMYCMESLLRDWVRKMLQIHLRAPVNSLVEWLNTRLSESNQLATGSQWFAFGGLYGPVVETSAVLLVLWLICLWMYRRGVFLRL